MTPLLFTNGTLLLADRQVPKGHLGVTHDRIDLVAKTPTSPPANRTIIDLAGGYLAPGFIDVHAKIECGEAGEVSELLGGNLVE